MSFREWSILLFNWACHCATGKAFFDNSLSFLTSDIAFCGTGIVFFWPRAVSFGLIPGQYDR